MTVEASRTFYQEEEPRKRHVLCASPEYFHPSRLIEKMIHEGSSTEGRKDAEREREGKAGPLPHRASPLLLTGYQ